MDRTHQHHLSRRGLLLGAAGGLVLAACSDGDGGSSAATTTAGAVDPTTAPAGGARTLISMFDPNGLLVTGSPTRAPFTIGDERGLPDADAAPAEITFTLLGPDDEEVVAPTTVAVHDDGVPVPYYPFGFTVDAPGPHRVVATVDGQELSAAVMVNDPGDVAFPVVGSVLPAIATPTPEATLDVDPICTLDPMCELHAVSVDEALAAGRPVALLVATPAFCQTALCGPTLDLLVDVAAEVDPSVAVIHLEVYQSAEAVEAGRFELAAPVAALGLAFEPILFVTDASGTVVSSLASAMDRAELRDAIALATA